MLLLVLHLHCMFLLVLYGLRLFPVTLDVSSIYPFIYFISSDVIFNVTPPSWSTAFATESKFTVTNSFMFKSKFFVNVFLLQVVLLHMNTHVLFCLIHVLLFLHMYLYIQILILLLLFVIYTCYYDTITSVSCSIII